MKVAQAVLLVLTAFTPQAGSGRPLPFTDQAWELRGEGAAIVEDAGRQVLQVQTGFAHRRDLRLENGTIDFDVQVTARRSFVYVHFRAVTDEEREEFYLRPHKSNLPDAVQYAPVWQGRSAWQLYHGPGGTAAVGFEPGVWTHVRVVVQGASAALFVKDMSRPALLVPRLAREPRAGGIALGGFLPGGVPGAGPVARFANVVVQPDAAAFDLNSAIAKGPTPEEEAPDAQIVRAWSVSRVFTLTESGLPSVPDSRLLGEFQRVEAGPGGLVALHRHVRVPEKTGTATAVARVRVAAARAGVYAFDLGFSDVATVFVNGRPVFRGDASYSFDRPRREGLIGFDQARVYLPLAAGDNELAVIVSDSFGGWGLMGRILKAEGLTIEAR